MKKSTTTRKKSKQNQKKTTGLLSFTAYGKRIGVSQQRVSKYVKTGQISDRALSVVGKRKMINPEIADADLAQSIDPSQKRKAAISQSDKCETIVTAGLNPNSPDFQTARALNEHYKAALKKLEFEKQDGLLLDAKQVEKEAFDLARQVRDAILNIPNRIADQIVVLNDRSEIIKVLTNELTNALEKLSQ